MILLRTCQGFDEHEACVELQISTWGYIVGEIMPRKAFLLAQKIGGQLIGAFDTEIAEAGPQSLIGTVFAWPGIKTMHGHPRPYLHSHMLAVRESYRNQGIGARLKMAQRTEAMERGITLMEWTFDPLEIKNAYLNLHKLGAIVRRYEPNFYGGSTSRLQGGLPTDRLVAEWQLDSPRVAAILAGNPSAPLAIEEEILVPAEIYQWKATDEGRAQARAVQSANREQFQAAFARGLVVVGYHRDPAGNGVFELSRNIKEGTQEGTQS